MLIEKKLISEQQNVDWLLNDSDNDGNYDDEATAKASFGLFSGSDTIIFQRELY